MDLKVAWHVLVSTLPLAIHRTKALAAFLDRNSILMKWAPDLSTDPILVSIVSMESGSSRRLFTNRSSPL